MVFFIRISIVALVLFGAGLAMWLQRGKLPSNIAPPERLACQAPAMQTQAGHAGMAWVPGGEFEFGDKVYPEEQPVRKTSVKGFWMDPTEVTNDQFSAFVKATNYVTSAERVVDAKSHPELPPDMLKPGAVVFVGATDGKTMLSPADWWRYVPGANWRHPGGPKTDIEGKGAFPVVAVTYEDAVAFANWRGNTLPTEAQWEWAARAGQNADPTDPTGASQPKQANTWQGLFPLTNSGEDGFVGLAPVGCYFPNAFGLFDMIGNVWELTSDVYAPNHFDLKPAPPDQLQRDFRKVPPGKGLTADVTQNVPQHVIKGGSYLCAPNYCVRYRPGSRQPQDDDLGASHLGFRTVLTAPGP